MKLKALVLLMVILSAIPCFSADGTNNSKITKYLSQAETACNECRQAQSPDKEYKKACDAYSKAIALVSNTEEMLTVFSSLYLQQTKGIGMEWPITLPFNDMFQKVISDPGKYSSDAQTTASYFDAVYQMGIDVSNLKKFEEYAVKKFSKSFEDCITMISGISVAPNSDDFVGKFMDSATKSADTEEKCRRLIEVLKQRGGEYSHGVGAVREKLEELENKKMKSEKNSPEGKVEALQVKSDRTQSLVSFRKEDLTTLNEEIAILEKDLAGKDLAWGDKIRINILMAKKMATDKASLLESLKLDRKDKKAELAGYQTEIADIDEQIKNVNETKSSVKGTVTKQSKEGSDGFFE